MAKRGIFCSYALQDIPEEVTNCLVPGAMLYENGEIPPILLLRLRVMEKIYSERPGTVFTVSGDPADTEAMLRYLGQSGVIPRHAIIRDSEGKNSYASIAGMLRKNGGRPFILLTSSFHLPRCAYIAHVMGADAYPFRITDYERRFSYEYIPRECLAIIKAFLQLKVIPRFHHTLSGKGAYRS